MRIPMSCWDCTWAEIEADEAEDEALRARGETPPERQPGRPLNPDNWYLANIEQDNAYLKTCRKGQETRMTLQSIRYELRLD